MAVEAMSCSLLVIIAEGTALPSIIKDYYGNMLGGLIVPAYNSVALSNGIKTLLNYSLLCEHIGNNARKIVENEYTINLYVNRHIELCNNVILQFNSYN
jgi:glycosyltransferase involved in cell wall biosynthesis